jgi:hypothetical protein
MRETVVDTFLHQLCSLRFGWEFTGDYVICVPGSVLAVFGRRGQSTGQSRAGNLHACLCKLMCTKFRDTGFIVVWKLVSVHKVCSTLFCLTVPCAR